MHGIDRDQGTDQAKRAQQGLHARDLICQSASNRDPLALSCWKGGIGCAETELWVSGPPERPATSLAGARVWVEKYERGEFDSEMEAANLLEQYEARIAALERMVGRLALENDLLKKASQAVRPPRDGKPS